MAPSQLHFLTKRKTVGSKFATPVRKIAPPEAVPTMRPSVRSPAEQGYELGLTSTRTFSLFLNTRPFGAGRPNWMRAIFAL